MYLGFYDADEYKKMDAFLIAYELGAMGECRFRDKLIEQIERKYGVPCPAEGLAKLLEIASKKTGQDLDAFFTDESMELLVMESDQANSNRFINYKRKQLIEMLEAFPEKVDLIWVSNFSREIMELKAWKGVNLTEAEMSESEEIIKKLKPLDEIMELRNGLLEKLKGNLM